MRRLVLGVFLIVWSVDGFVQDYEKWKQFIKHDIPSSRLTGDSHVFMIEGRSNDVRASDRWTLLRSIDENHHIVKGNYPDIYEKAWSVNDQWKLNLSAKAKHSFFYIVTTASFDFTPLDHFEVIREYPSSNTFLINGSLKEVEQYLLPHVDVIHITNKIHKPSVESRVIDMNLNPNRVNKVHHHYPLLNGSTETVSIQENNFRDTDIDLLNRSLPSGLESESVDNHATEMATIIAGAGNSFITGGGVASDVTIISSDFSDAMPDADQHYLEFNINTQNHSYGIPRESIYGVGARAFDLSAFQNKNLLHVFSSGNQGLEVSSDGVYANIEGFANLTGNIKMAKNSLVVGSVDTVGNVPTFVSRGPTYDGRVKPEVVAYSVVGSSNSAALVSGVATLLQQRYRADEASDMPSALTKALLINGAVDVGPDGLDFIAGYGSVNASRSLETLINGQYIEGVVTDATIESFALSIPSNALNLKVTLCWTDQAANVNDFPALVNDLDLRLVDGSSAITLPWVLNTSANVTDLAKAAERGVDQLNNVEQVTISSPANSYTIEVEGSAVSGNQDFYLVWQYDLADSFEWDFPTGSDNMPYNGETGSYFRWTTTKTGVGTLAYSIDNVNWITLDSNVDLETGYWRWNNPPSLENEVKARMEIGAEIIETDLFTVSETFSAEVGFNCADSVLLKWDPSPNAMNYTVSNLGTESLEEYTVTADTFLIIPNKGSFSDTRFSIQPNLPSGKSVLPTPTFDYTLQGIECFVFSFFQTVALDTGIYLNLSLGTTYGIDRIVFERNNFSSIVEIGSVTDLNEEITFLDTEPNQGFNEHTAKIYFNNGEELTLSTGTSYYLTEVPLKIYPSIVKKGESFNIITREFTNTASELELLDHEGVIVHTQLINSTQDEIRTDDLSSGIYFYRLRADGSTYSGRILIR